MQVKTFRWTIPDNRSGDWTRGASDDAFHFETGKDTELTCVFTQPSSVLQKFEVPIDCEGTWLVEFYVNNAQILQQKLTDGQKTLAVATQQYAGTEGFEVSMRVTPVGQGRLTVAEEVLGHENQTSLARKKALVLVAAITILAYLSTCVALVTKDYGILTQVFATIGTAAGFVGVSWSIKKWSLPGIRRIARSTVATALTSVVALFALTLLLEFTTYQIAKANYSQTIRTAAADARALTAAELQDLALTQPNRKEPWVLLEYRVQQTARAIGGNEGRALHREFYREFFGISKAFDQNTLVNQEVIESQLAQFCQSTDLTPWLPIKFINLLDVSTWVYLFDTNAGEEVAGCAFATNRVSKAFLPLKDDCDISVEHQVLEEQRQEILATIDDPTANLGREIFDQLKTDIGPIAALPHCGANMTTQDAFDTCISDLSVAARNNVNALNMLPSSNLRHEYQFVLASWAWAQAGICARANQAGLETAAIRQDMIGRFSGLITLRRSMSGAGATWPDSPQNLPLHMAMLHRTYKSDYQCASRLSEPLFRCFGGEEAFRSELSASLDEPMASDVWEYAWWTRGTLEVFIDRDGNPDARLLQDEISKLLDTNWRI